MTKRTYVKPEWHAMGMPIAEAACHTGAEDVVIQKICESGTSAKTSEYPYDCRNGSDANVFCVTGTGVGNKCADGGGFNT